MELGVFFVFCSISRAFELNPVVHECVRCLSVLFIWVFQLYTIFHGTFRALELSPCVHELRLLSVRTVEMSGVVDEDLRIGG